jgi:CheY-like chemotaxis protein
MPRILLAEDSPTNQLLATAFLEEQGHSVVVARNGLQAVEKFHDEEFDFILMDVHMPEMDGLEATRLIRQRELSTGRRIPIIAMTASAMDGDRERCLESGMDDYVSKPMQTDELFAALARVQTEASSRNTGSALLIDWDAARSAVNGDQGILESVIEAVLEEGPGLLDQLGQARMLPSSGGLPTRSKGPCGASIRGRSRNWRSRLSPSVPAASSTESRNSSAS